MNEPIVIHVRDYLFTDGGQWEFYVDVDLVFVESIPEWFDLQSSKVLRVTSAASGRSCCLHSSDVEWLIHELSDSAKTGEQLRAESERRARRAA